MSLHRRTLVLISLTFATAAHAQSAPTPTPPNPWKMLSVFQEFVKPARNAAHEAHEAGWPAAFTKAGNPIYSLALTSMTGNNDALYITAYPSYADMEKANTWMDKAPGMQAAMDRLAEKDAEFLANTRAMMLTQQEDQTIGTPLPNLDGLRGFMIRTTRVKMGRNADYAEYTKLVQEGYRKANIDPHIATYAVSMGVTVPTYMTFRRFHSIAEMDEWPAQANAMRAALTQEQRDRMDKLIENSFTTRESEIYMVSPKMSYMSMAMMKADPEFWKSSPPMQLASTKKPAMVQAGAPKKP